MAGNSAKRLTRELANIAKEPSPDYTVQPISESDLFLWSAIIRGPAGTAYEGGNFVVEINVPQEYPFKPPVFRFSTKIYHPSIKQDDGSICGEILTDWKPSIQIKDVLSDLVELLKHPDYKSPLEPEIAKQLQEDPNAFIKVAREWTKKFAK
eukprot:NODE_9528_length_583_cov_27.708696_g8891_i0.p1 GENE.NODE_9528_length_583_cov_27.708696_g8891_i0~~NODE_9528_length_583_cov_27.708696_g8891_i0.p1  ORF type:complete len:152 (+),score=18.13 NODE_9528_length_583_cov_27.708696_g8891_i0:69-524(+)